MCGLLKKNVEKYDRNASFCKRDILLFGRTYDIMIVDLSPARQDAGGVKTGEKGANKHERREKKAVSIG